jgi:hypothetical protein
MIFHQRSCAMGKLTNSVGLAVIGGAAVLGTTSLAAASNEHLKPAASTSNALKLTALNTVDVKRSDVQATSDGVVIANPALASQYRANRAATIAALSRRFGSISDKQVSLTADGRLMISSSVAKVDLGKAAGNFICNGNCAPTTRIPQEDGFRAR